MKDQDRRAVEGMARCGISLEGLIEAFPKFPKEDIEKIYNEINKITTDDNTGIKISINCS